MLICVTNRKLCPEDFLNRLNLLAQGHPKAIMLREKDLSLTEYQALATEVKQICDLHRVTLIINQNVTVAAQLELTNVHLSMSDLRQYQNKLAEFVVGASVHSVEEAKEAEKLGASYLVAGHIFATHCKKGMPPRGLSFLRAVCDAVSIPVYAIGGITQDKVANIIKTGAKGVCVMSEAMTCANPVALTNSFRR
ncbi:thiamine phosphate synthase [Peptococcaceae bacterium 1198_IL3148]